jgi:hypothetical protein
LQLPVLCTGEVILDASHRRSHLTPEISHLEALALVPCMCEIEEAFGLEQPEARLKHTQPTVQRLAVEDGKKPALAFDLCHECHL